jgi:hypothetical protein
MLETIVVIILLLWLFGFFGGRRRWAWSTGPWYDPLGVLVAIILALLLFAVLTDVIHAQAINTADPNQALSTRELWSAAVGIAVPLLVSVPIQPGWPSWSRAVFGVVVCIVVAAGTAWLDGSVALSGNDAVFRSVLLVLLGAWSSYSTFWKPTGITQKIELATSGATNSRSP